MVARKVPILWYTNSISLSMVGSVYAYYLGDMLAGRPESDSAILGFFAYLHFSFSVCSVSHMAKKKVKQGSTLLMTLLGLMFMSLLLSGLQFDRSVRYWLAHNHRDEVFAYYQALSALEVGEKRLQMQWSQRTSPTLSFEDTFSLNGGTCSFQCNTVEHELLLTGVGIQEKVTTYIQNRYKISDPIRNSYIFCVQDTIQGNGRLVFTEHALTYKTMISVCEIPTRITMGTNFRDLWFSKASVSVDTSIANHPVFKGSETGAFAIGPSIYYDNPIELKSDQWDTQVLYVAKDSLTLNLLEAANEVEIPSVCGLGCIEILAREDQTLILHGILLTNHLVIYSGTLCVDPIPEKIPFLEEPYFVTFSNGIYLIESRLVYR